MRKRVSGYNIRMDFFIPDPNVEQMAPADTRLLNLIAEPYPDGKRLRVVVDLTPFQQKPYLALTLTNTVGEVISSSSVIEPVAYQLEFTLHIRKPDTFSGGKYKLAVFLSFPDLGEIDRRELTIEIPSPTV